MLQKLIFITFIGLAPSLFAQEEVELVNPIAVIMEHRSCPEKEATKYYDDLAETLQEVKSGIEGIVNDNMTLPEIKAKVNYLMRFFEPNAIIEVAKLNANGTYTVSTIPIRNYFKRLIEWGKQGNVSLKWKELEFQKTERGKTIITITEEFKQFSTSNEIIDVSIAYRDFILEETVKKNGTFKFKIKEIKVIDIVPTDIKF